MLNSNATSRNRITLFILALAFLILAPKAGAQTKSFDWTNWDIDIVLQPDGSLNVTETQTLDFQGAPFTFGFRSIPVGRKGNNDGISNISVREGDQVYVKSSSNQPGTFEILNDGGETRINWYFEPALGSHTYTFSYTVSGAVRTGTSDEGSGDQIYWTVIPSDHPSRVASSRITITLPEGISPQKYFNTDDYLVAAYLNGTRANSVLIDVSEDARFITFQTQQSIMPGTELDVRVQFPHGLLPTPTPRWQAAEQREDAMGVVILAISLLLFVVGPLGVVLLWYLRGRDPQLGIVVPDYITDPPDPLPPAMVGSLIDEKVDMQDIMSTLVDLAHRGYILMEESKKSYTFKRTDKPIAGLRKFEGTFLNDLFSNKDIRTLESLRYKFSGKIPRLRNQIIEELVTEGYFPRSPYTVKSIYVTWSGLILFLGIVSIFLFGIFLGDNAGYACCPVIAIMITALSLFIAARHMPRKTAKGAEAALKWEAFKTYLKNIKQYADIESTNDIFDKYLSYAIAFGLERSFINTFAQSPSTMVPPWYIPTYQPGQVMAGGIPGTSRPGKEAGSPSGIGGMPSLGDVSGGLTGGLAGMSSSLTRMLNNTSTIMKSTPPPSNTGGGGIRFGGGSSSGGFSGGFSGGSSGGGGSAGFG